jgi:hypothetical protein
MADDVMAALEQQFSSPANSGPKVDSRPCKECNAEPAINGECRDCREHDGGCLRCTRCRYRLTDALAVGLAAATWDHRAVVGELRDVISCLGRCDMEGVIWALIFGLWGLYRTGTANRSPGACSGSIAMPVRLANPERTSCVSVRLSSVPPRNVDVVRHSATR